MSFLYRFVNHFIDSLSHQLLGYNRFSPIFLINYERNTNCGTKSLIDDMNNGFVFATQKKRRTAEKRLRRRFGVEAYPDSCPIIRPKRDLIVCDNCGHFHELHTICGECYKKVREESTLIIDKLRKHFNYDEPIEEEIHIKYKDENIETDPNGLRIVEMDRQRPEWFAKNLLSKSLGNKWVERSPVLREDEPKVIKD